MFSFPRIPELLFAAVLIWLFASGQGWSVLLADGDTGWHIRNGEQILDTRTVPRRDPFSFDTGQRAWFAWEWLSDVLFAVLYRAAGLRGVCLFCGITLAAYLSVLFRHLLDRSVGVMLALPLTLIVAGASAIHYLARPHAIGLLFFAGVAWIVDRHRVSPRCELWLLPPLFVLWANCHGSFLAGLALLSFLAVEKAVLYYRAPCQRRRRDLRRCGSVAVLAGFATFCNPYGWRLHLHALDYLRSAWIQTTIEEFQSPRFRSESMLQYEFLLVCGLAALPWCWRRSQIYPALVILFWAHESLASVRHVTLYCLAASPFLACWAQSAWTAHGRGPLFLKLESVNRLWNSWTTGCTVWPVVFCAGLTLLSVPGVGLGAAVNFPANKFPVILLQQNAGLFDHARGAPLRIFSSDQWSDYLIFRAYPSVRVFFDGRSDFFADWRGQAYLDLMAGAPDCTEILEHQQIGLVLLPKTWSLVGLLSRDVRWRILDADQQAVLFQRIAPEIKQSRAGL